MGLFGPSGSLPTWALQVRGGPLMGVSVASIYIWLMMYVIILRTYIGVDHTLFMMNRKWNIMNWNVRGINSQERWDDIRDRTEESQCDIICLQESKRDFFDTAYLRKFCHRKFN